MKNKKIYIYTLVALTTGIITNISHAENNYKDTITLLSTSSGTDLTYEVDKSKLLATISAAENLVKSVTIGISDGMYTQESVNTLNKVITESKEIANFSESTQGSINTQLSKLEEAIESFKSSEIAEYLTHKEELKLKIQDCLSVLSSSKEGTAVGEYPKEATSKFKVAIANAEKVAAKIDKNSAIYINASDALSSAKTEFEGSIITNEELETYKNKLNSLLSVISTEIKNNEVGSVNGGVTENQKVALSVVYSRVNKMVADTSDIEIYNKAYEIAKYALSDFRDGSISIDESENVNGNKLTGVDLAGDSKPNYVNVNNEEEFIPQAGLPFNMKGLLNLFGTICIVTSACLFNINKKQKA